MPVAVPFPVTVSTQCLWLTHLFEVCGRLDFSHGLHEGVPHNDADVCARVALRLPGQLLDVGVREAVRRAAQMQPEHLGAGCLLRQRDVNPLFKPREPSTRLDLRADGGGVLMKRDRGLTALLHSAAHHADGRSLQTGQDKDPGSSSRGLTSF